ncbi:hypothetical protein B0J11DRAFT_508372 [Dendryphion nanum]|uniref:Uncharacterized protein n=1 Tax=Dendryphion nanum TaxID=256645 RepID=A0A9P9DHJ8_9PLEO|nr:hypothetical protein B0J11DRAFT_508372 [Dendryphion nanum]
MGHLPGPNLSHSRTIHKEEILINLISGLNLDFFQILILCCTILALQALCKKANAEAGITTVKFNLTAAFPNIHIVQKRDFIQSLRTEAKSVANGIVTAVPSVISQVQSAADTLATALPGEVEALIPRNCSIGTKKFCLGLAHNVTRHSLPLNMSKFVPAGVEKVFQINLNDIQPLNDALAKVTMANIQDALIIGVVLAFIVTTISMCSISAKHLPPWIQVEEGEPLVVLTGPSTYSDNQRKLYNYIHSD